MVLLLGSKTSALTNGLAENGAGEPLDGDDIGPKAVAVIDSRPREGVAPGLDSQPIVWSNENPLQLTHGGDRWPIVMRSSA
jgi:hypothetical protein